MLLKYQKTNTIAITYVHMGVGKRRFDCQNNCAYYFKHSSPMRLVVGMARSLCL